ncbi:DUF6338 family protein [Streptomyces sp. Qhu_M48]|uniref:DUF6338 family protein n=1 Tax=Streptomyces sp. Qhu_M48 TaxID=3435889 RepID=UPI003F4F9360
MGGAPATVAHLALVILVIAPGITYQLLRERWRGAMPGEQDIAQRVLRALVASVALDAVYALVIGPHLLEFAGPGDVWTVFREHLRATGAAVLGLVFAIPAAAAWCVSRLERRRLRGTYRSTPTAWDHMFRDCPPSFVRARLKDGTWVGGWYGSRSYAAFYPHPPGLFLERSYRMKADGTFSSEITRSAGIYVDGANIDILELLTNAATEAPDEPEQQQPGQG